MSPGERAASAVIFFLSKDVGRAIHLNETHVANELGHCLGCHTQMAPTIHPCIIRRLADETLSRLIPKQRDSGD